LDETTGRALLQVDPRGLSGEPSENLALEEALFLKNEGFTVRVWENRESVIIGRAQRAEFETDLDYCRANGIPVVRRFTAGGAVYHGPGNLNWSLFVSSGMGSGGLRYETSPGEIFRSASSPLISSLAACGVTARLDPPNRILSDDGKVSGMAAYVSRRGFLCHGTLLVSADLERVKKLTTPSKRELERRYTRSRDFRTANTRLSVDSFIRTFVSTLADETGMTIESGPTREEERELARELLSSRYGTHQWNLGDPFAWADEAGVTQVR
jgi:lipoate-protein ligase A